MKLAKHPEWLPAFVVDVMQEGGVPEGNFDPKWVETTHEGKQGSGGSYSPEERWPSKDCWPE